MYLISSILLVLLFCLLNLFLLFFIFSFLLNIYQVFKKRISCSIYLIFYYEYIIVIIGLSILFYLLKIKIIYALYIIAFTDFFIQSLFQINNSAGNKIAKKIGVTRIKRGVFYPLSLQTYFFKGFSCHIFEPSKICPLRDYLVFNDFLNFKKKSIREKHQFGKENVYSFEIITDKTSKKMEKEMKSPNQNDACGFIQNKKIMRRLVQIDKEIPVVTSFYTGAYKTVRLRIVIDKRYCERNPQKIYTLLKTYVIKYKVNKSCQGYFPKPAKN